MKEKIFNYFMIIISIFILSQLLINKQIIYVSIMYALNMWVNSLLPSLFPFFIISDILINYNIINYLPKRIRGIIKKIFRINDNMLMIFLLSMIAGFPSNARNVRTLYNKGLISIEEANHILIYSHFANPIFILTIVGECFLNSRIIGIMLLVTHYLSNIILGILFRNNYFVNTMNNNNSVISFSKIFINSIKKAIDTILLICGILTIFLVLSTVIVNTFHFNSYNTMIIKGLLEITIGIEALGKLNLSMIYKTVLASMFLAFGGISVHVQVISQITDTNINYMYYFIGRMYQMMLAGLLTYIGCLIMGI